MPLRKLWNSIRGTGSQPASSGNDVPNKRPTKPSNNAPEKRRILSAISGGPHAALCKKIKSLRAQKILEVGIGDGTRAAEVIRTLRAANPDGLIQYNVIDQFEMCGGEITLKAYHQQLRSIGVTPNLIPMPLPVGIQRIANTVGVVDLVLLDGVELTSQEAVLDPRVVSPATTVLRIDNGTWNFVQQVSEPNRRAA